MNNRHRISERDEYRIKVNKKDTLNSIYRPNNSSNNSNFNSIKLYKNNTYIPPFQSIKTSMNFTDNSMSSPYSNTKIINTKIIKCKNNSNSEEKIRKNNMNMNIYEEQNTKDGNILEDLINNKYLKPILECQDIDEKLLNCNLKEPVKNSFNVSLNDFFNRKKKYLLNFKTPKLENNKMSPILSLNTHNYSNNNNDNFINSDIIIHNNRTFESNNNINNYYNDIQMTNNYYNNNEINLLNFPSYNDDDIIPFTSEGKKVRDYSYIDNNRIYSSYDNNQNLFKNKHNTYVNINKNLNEIDYINEENDMYNENDNIIIENSPLNYYFKSQTYTQKQNKNTNVDNYINYRPKKQTFNNKQINIMKNIGNGNITIKSQNNRNINENNEYKNNKYDKIKNIIKENNNNIKQNKYDYNKKLFDIYRGKLIKEFLRYMEKAINKYLLRIFKYFIDVLSNKVNPSSNNKIDEIFIPKIHLEKTNQNENNGLIRGSANLKKQKYYKLFNSDKKYPQTNYLINKNNLNILNLSQLNLDNKKNKNINNSFIINNEKKNEIIIKNNKLIKINQNDSSKQKKKNNTNILMTNRYSLLTDNININNKLSNIDIKNNIQVIDINNSLNQYIYKKKVRLSKNIIFANKTNKISKSNKEINKEDILSNSNGKIIDIDINLGKSIKEISDINPLENMFINNYNNKTYKISLSTKKREKRKTKRKSKSKKLSLPKKKYAEEEYDSFQIKNDEEEELDYINHNIRNNSYDNKLNNPINLNNSYNLNNKYFKTFINDDNNKDDIDIINNNKNYKNILVKNIATLDKRLFIHINYIFCLSSKNNSIKNKKYENNFLITKRNIYFSIISQHNCNKQKKKYLSNNSIVTRNCKKIIFENENDTMNKTNYMNNNKDKYLFSCVKFIIKNINKVFLNKAFKFFISCVEEKYNKNRNIRINKYKINTYKKKISKGKI